MAQTNETTVTREAWAAVVGKRVYFGHQSVGDNVLDGVKTLAETHGFQPLRIVEHAPSAIVDGPALVHTKIGQNGDPQSKVRGFREALEGGLGGQVDVALMKFCFWDIRKDTDIDGVFAEYRQTLAELERRYPAVTFVHATVPLVAADVDWRARVRRLVGMTTPTDEDNAARERLNTKIREVYGASQLFDIARAEEAENGSEPPGQLAAAFSSDGAHLNASGRRRVGAALIRSLSAVPVRTTASR